jgi:hypothetical protein
MHRFIERFERYLLEGDGKGHKESISLNKSFHSFLNYYGYCFYTFQQPFHHPFTNLSRLA